MGASFAAVVGLGAFMALSLLNENRVTGQLQRKVQGENLIHLARETNESTLSRTRGLLIAEGASPAALKVLPNGEFQKVSGSKFEVIDGRMRMFTPVPPAGGWTGIPGNNAPELLTDLKIENLSLDSAGMPTVIVVSATTTAQQAGMSKTISTKARFDLNALGLPSAPTAVAALPSAPSPSAPPATMPGAPPAAPAVAGKAADPCAPAPAVPTAVADVGIGNAGGGTGIANTGGGIGIGNVGSGVGIGNTNGGIGIGNNGGIGIGSECGGIGINAPAGCIGIGLGGKSCLGIRYK